MNNPNYKKEIEKRFIKLFQSSKEGYKASPQERHRLEGFIEAGIYLKLISKAEVKNLMDKSHQSIFNKTIEEKQKEQSNNLQDESIDYSYYDKPLSMR